MTRLVIGLVAAAMIAAVSGGSDAASGRRIVVRRPRNREVWTESSPVEVRWRAPWLGERMLLVQLSRDGGRRWTEIGSARADEKRFDWTAVGPPGRVLLQLGTRAGEARSRARRVTIAPAVREVSIGGEFAASVHTDGSMRTWGYYPFTMYPRYVRFRRPRVLRELANVVSIAAGGNHLLAIRSDGKVLLWGDHDGDTGPLPGYVEPVVVAGLDGASLVRAEFDTSFVRLNDGRVFSWGSNRVGSLGDGSGVRQMEPVPVAVLDGVVDIALGRFHGIALLPDGRILSWGWNESGQVGDGTFVNRPTPVLASIPRPAVAIAAGGRWSMALLDDGSVVSWGNNQFLQLGRASRPDRDPNPSAVPGLENVAALACGFHSGYALRQDGGLYAWGINDRGEFGDGTTVERITPALVPLAPLSRLFVGGGTVHALTTEGRRIAWGANVYALVGDGSWWRDRLAPVEIISR